MINKINLPYNLRLSRFKVCIYPIILLLVLTASCRNGSGNHAKDYKIERINNIDYVTNPSTPQKGFLTLQLEKTLEISSSDLSKEKPVTFGIIAKNDDGKIYIGDPYELNVLIFRPDGTFLNRFLNRGAGPGECETGLLSIQALNHHLWIPEQMKFMKFDDDGKFIEETRFTKKVRDALVIDENRFLVNRFVYPEGNDSANFKCIASLVDKNGTVLKDYVEGNNIGSTRAVKTVNGSTFRQNYTLNTVTPKILFQFDPKSKRIYFCTSNRYELQVMNLEGQLLKVIRRTHENMRLDANERSKIIETFFATQTPDYKKFMRETLPENLCAISEIRILPNGHIVIHRITGFLTFEMDVFNPDGIFIRTLKIPGIKMDSQMFFFKQNLIVLESSDDDDYFYREYRVKNYNDIIRI